MKKIKIVLAGLLLVCLDFPISTGISYGIEHIKGESAGRGFIVGVIQTLIGRNISIDILPDVIGYILLILGMHMLVSYHKRFKMGMIGAVVGLIASVVSIAVPMMPMSVGRILEGIAIFKAIDLFCYIFIVFCVARGVFAQVDSYKHLEMWNDYKFFWDIIAIAPPFIYLLGLATIIEFPMSAPLQILLYGLWLYASISFIYRVYTDCKSNGIFE